jgi:subtilisin family serine protease
MSVSPMQDSYLVAEGIRWAVAHGAKVINMSFEGKSGDATVQSAVDEAVAADVVLVACAGNDDGPILMPARLDGVLAVGSVTSQNKVADFSNSGKQLDLVTYGTNMPSARPHNRYATVHGTSDSSALVSGVVALMRARYPDMSAVEVVDRLTRTATDRGAKGRDDHYGYGQLNVVAALTAPRTPPSATATPTRTGDAAQAPVAYTPTTERRGIPPLLFVAAGILLLIVAAVAFVIVRVRRNS